MLHNLRKNKYSRNMKRTLSILAIITFIVYWVIVCAWWLEGNRYRALQEKENRLQYQTR